MRQNDKKDQKKGDSDKVVGEGKEMSLGGGVLRMGR